ncbi:MAG: carbohydrate ABC transporter permease, partial [bacterium]|nr:carbohydrate ABC transporter permease [bacterium]
MIDPVSIIPPSGPRWENYREAFEKLNFFNYLKNSVFTSSAICALIILIYSMFGFALAKIDFAGKRLLFYFYLSMLFVPGLALTVPLFVNLSALGLGNTFLGLILPQINGAGPIAMFMFRNYFQKIPHELYECAISEGASKGMIYSRIYLPLSTPIIMTVLVMNFLSSWNALLWPMIILNDAEKFTLPLGLLRLNMSAFPKMNMTMTGGIISIVPVLIIFFAVQKYYIQGLTAGAVKG